MEKDVARAAGLYRQAADQGDRTAACNLGYLYETGKGVAQSWQEAVRWYRQSAGAGYARAQYRLARCLETGHGTAKDADRALELYRQAADQGYEGAGEAVKRLEGGGKGGLLKRLFRDRRDK